MNIHYGQVLLKQLYDIEVETEDFEETALLAWNYIGNKNVKLYRISLAPDCDNSVTLPCNAVEGEIEAVTIPYEDWNRTSNIYNHGDISSAVIENDIERLKSLNNPMYIPGKLVNYEKVGEKLYFPVRYSQVNILYKGVLVDEEGLPEVSDKEALAIATYIAYVEKFKEGLKTNNVQITNLATALELKWLKQCDQARVQPLSLNQLNNILDAKSKWNRKIFNMSYKPY